MKISADSYWALFFFKDVYLKGVGMNVKIKLCDNGVLPTYAHIGDACCDCCAAEDSTIAYGQIAKVKLGFCLELPEGYEAQIRPRSGLSSKGIVSMFGTIDSNYRGEVCVVIQNNSFDDFEIKFGDRICQMKIERVEPVVFDEVVELSDTVRGCNGFGSTGV